MTLQRKRRRSSEEVNVLRAKILCVADGTLTYAEIAAAIGVGSDLDFVKTSVGKLRRAGHCVLIRPKKPFRHRAKRRIV